MLKSYGAHKNLFFPNMDKKGPKIGYFLVLWTLFNLCFLKTMESESSFDSCDSIANPVPGKIHVLELLPKMVLANQLIFCLQINIRVSYKLVLVLLMGVSRHAQSTQNTKFAISYQSFLQAGSIVFTGHSQACPKYPKLQVCNFFAISQKRREGWSCAWR